MCTRNPLNRPGGRRRLLGQVPPPPTARGRRLHGLLTRGTKPGGKNPGRLKLENGNGEGTTTVVFRAHTHYTRAPIMGREKRGVVSCVHGYNPANVYHFHGRH